MKRIAVILFPGNNCEEETARVITAAGMKADIVRWNVDASVLRKYDGYVLGGGWAYEDRIRAGVVAAKDPVVGLIKEEAAKGKIVLGICNGAQVLVESGMIPCISGEPGKIEMALAPNENPFVSGYYCSWVNLKHVCKRKTAFNLELDEVIPMPIAHGEGMFVTKDEHLLQELIDNDQIMFRYCDEEGEILAKFPVNPNGSLYNIAGICNKEGNVMAMMPHPERASWMKQLPYHEDRSFKELEKAAPARRIFESMREYLESQ